MYIFRQNKLIKDLIHEIELELGFIEIEAALPFEEFHFLNKIKTIQASLAIEANRLDVWVIEALAKGENPAALVPGFAKDVIEAKNALKTYDNLKKLDPLKLVDLLHSHGILMNKLVKKSGNFRNTDVYITNGVEIIYEAPKSNLVLKLMEELFDFIKTDKLSWLLKAIIFHYEYEVIHPFVDGNGRMGRLWQQLLLMKYNPIFEFVPVDVSIKTYQSRYYEAFRKSDAANESTPFIEYILITILSALKQYRNDLQTEIFLSEMS